MHSPLVSHVFDTEFTTEHEHSICIRLQEREVMVLNYIEVMYIHACVHAHVTYI